MSTASQIVQQAIAERTSVIKAQSDLRTGIDAHRKTSELGKRVSDLQLLERTILRALAAEGIE